MTSPPAHLLPLALEAMTSDGARQVLCDALLESGWWDAKVWLVLYGQWAAVGSIHTESLRHTWITLASDKLPRAIAAVLLFGSWSTARWPLVEANGVRRLGGEFTRLRADIAEAHARMAADGRAATTVFMHPSDYRTLRRELGSRTVFTGSMHQGAPIMRLSLEHGDVRVYIDPYLEPGLLSIGSFNMSREEDDDADLG